MSAAPQPALAVLDPASLEAEQLAELGWVLIVGATALFLLTMLLLGLALRRRKPSIAPAWWLLGGGVALPASVLSVLLVYSVLRTQGLERPPGGDVLVVGVTGHLWWWELRYPGPGGEQIVSANELRIPVGRPVRLALASADVIHSFWVPALGGKMDLVPGRINSLTITARRPGVYRGQCAEYCGEQHARMALHVVALAPADFEAWLRLQAQPAAVPRDAVAAQGRAAFLAQGCAACHSVRGVAEAGGRGPDLTHVGGRLYLGAGALPNDAVAMRRWIAEVQAVKPGAQMPSFPGLEPATLQALSAYLSQLQ
jgi:cytochrome c oxidase subunit 2